MKNFNSIKCFIEHVLSYQNILVYGFGNMGKALAKGLKKYYSIEINAFVVTKISEQNKDALTASEIPVLDVVNAVKELDNYIILISNESEVEKEEIAGHMKCNNINSFTNVPGIFWYALYAKNINQIPAIKLAEKSEDRKFRIGYLRPGYSANPYAEERLIINKLNCKSDLKSKVKYCSIPREVDENSRVADSFYCPQIYQPDVDVIHTFNTVCVTSLKWCSSFETNLPRILSTHDVDDTTYEKLVEQIEKDNCLGVFPLCQNACDIAKQLLENRIGRKRAQQIGCKMTVLHPPQAVLLSEQEEQNRFYRDAQEITFLFIASAFFFKGGKEIIRALKCFEGKYKFKLRILGGIRSGWFDASTVEDIRNYNRIVREVPWIDFLGYLPNELVLEECKKADVGLLPSYADTYGYSVLEMQAGGCPVITSNVRAFPEINNEHCGWICHLPVKSENNACKKELGLETLGDILTEELKKCFEEIFNHPESIAEKGKASLKRIQEEHDPVRYADTLWKMYQK